MEAGFKNGIISLDKRTATYYTGQEISGAVHFKLDNILLFKAINLEIIGEARVHWVESQMVRYRGVEKYGEVQHKGHVEYFNYVQNLCGGQGVSQLPPQSFTLSFKFQIPHKVPSSFKSEKGQIVYTIRAYIEFPDPLMSIEEIIKEFKVVAPYHLDKSDPTIKQPTELVLEEMLAFNCICTPHPLTVRVRLPASGYCPGDTIPVTISVHNESSVDVKSIKLQIILRECYRSQQPRAEYVPPEKVVVQGKVKDRPKINSKREFGVELKVPNVLVPAIDCPIISLNYYFKVIVKVSGFNRNLEALSEIHLGMIPLHKTQIGWAPHIAEKLPGGHLPDPSIPTTPGIRAIEPFPSTPVPAMNPSISDIGWVEHIRGTPIMPASDSEPSKFSGYPSDGASPMPLPPIGNITHPAPSAPPLS